MKPHTPELATAGVVLVAALMVFVLPAGLASGTAVSPAASPSETLWAYGAVRVVNFSGSTSGGWEYQGQATYGYSVTLNQTNTSSTTFELSLNRAMGARIAIDLCLSPCTTGVSSTANFTYHSWELSGAYANFTTAGTVTEGTASVPAIALTDSHSFANASLVETAMSDLAGVLRSRLLSVSTNGDAELNFTTPLGLLPLNLSTGQSQSWTSSSAFNASGSAAYSYSYAQHGPLVNRTVGPLTGSASLSGTGTVSVAGQYTAGNSIRLGGVEFPAIELTVTGPFSVREGVIFVPDNYNVFSGAAQPWSANLSGSATAEMTYLDALPHAGGHLGLDGSVWTYASTSVNPAANLTLAPLGGPSPAVAPSSPTVPSETLQGEPQSQSQAEATQNCVVSGSDCPAATTVSSPSAPTQWWHGVLGLAILGTVAAVLVAAAVVIGERRRMPPPVYPNAGLYPPGSTGRTVPSSTARGPDEPAPSEDDPLKNLW